MPIDALRRGNVNEEESSVESLDNEEEELRAITSCSLHCFDLLQPSEKVLQGPGAGPGPRRYLGVIKPMMLFHWCEKWCLEQGFAKPSFSTFMRVLRECSSFLRFRKTQGQHPVCDSCWFLERN